jgi:ParB-like chromosome segregation protein Spo0J
MPEIRIDQRIKAHIPPLRPEEFAQLEANILKEGCLAPLTIWSDVLIDGHNRYAICQKHGLPFKVNERIFDDIDAALEWIENNQLGRRNLTPEQFNFYLGKKLERQVGQQGGDRKSEDAKSKSQNETLIGDTATRIAKEHGVTRATVSRAGEFVRAVEVLARIFGPEVEAEVLNPDRDISREGIKTIAKAIKNGETFASWEQAKEKYAPKKQPKPKAEGKPKRKGKKQVQPEPSTAKPEVNAAEDTPEDEEGVSEPQQAQEEAEEPEVVAEPVEASQDEPDFDEALRIFNVALSLLPPEDWNQFLGLCRIEVDERKEALYKHTS